MRVRHLYGVRLRTPCVVLLTHFHFLHRGILAMAPLKTRRDFLRRGVYAAGILIGPSLLAACAPAAAPAPTSPPAAAPTTAPAAKPSAAASAAPSSAPAAAARPAP